MRIAVALLVLRFLVTGQEINPVQPAAVKLLRDPAQCVRYAKEVGRALQKMSRKTEHGVSFAKSPGVYDGDAGVSLFLFSLYKATHKAEWLALGRRTLAHAYATRKQGDISLYSGDAGIGEACLHAWRVTGDKAFLEQARSCAPKNAAYTATDVIFGSAGTGIFLLNLHAATNDARYEKAARAAGDYLARTAIRKGGTARWPIAPGGNPTVYVGLSHGAAGMGQFLLHLYRATKEASYRSLAEDAARFVLAEAVPDGTDGSHWERKSPPQHGDTIRVQWCHGAPGIGLFYADLARHFGGEAYRQALARCVATTRRLGRTARRSGCQCHGVAGNAELLLEAGEAGAHEFASALLVRAESGYRVRVEGYAPSYMTGLAGIGHFFLRLADPKTPLPMTVRLSATAPQDAESPQAR